MAEHEHTNDATGANNPEPSPTPAPQGAVGEAVAGASSNVHETSESLSKAKK